MKISHLQNLAYYQVFSSKAQEGFFGISKKTHP